MCKFQYSRTIRSTVVELPIGPYESVMGLILLSTVPLHLILTRNSPEDRVGVSELFSEINQRGYKWHISIYFLMFGFKALIDQHNEAIKPRVGGFTHVVHDIEGDITIWAQERFKWELLTDVLSFHYLFVYLFIIWFSPIYYILSRDEAMADKAVLNYVVIYVLAVPLYLFFNIEVTSSFVPGMEALLYHEAWYLFFFTEVDPLDNGIPSLHIGIPICLLITNRLHVRSLGISISQWKHREYDLFLLLNVPVYLFSIQYLGIHWISDIIPGIVLAVICAVFSHNLQPILRSQESSILSELKTKKEAILSSLAFSLVGALFLIFVVVDGPGVEGEEPTMRLGPGDVNLDVVEVHSLWHPAEVEIRNVGEESLEVIVVHRDLVLEHVDHGVIFWNSLPGGQIQSLGPNESISMEVDTPSVRDGHFVLVSHQGASGIGEARVTTEYVDEGLVWSAVLCSIPCFAIVGYVLAEQFARRDSVR